MERTRLTKRVVDAQTADKERFVWDAELPGFGLRVWPSGRKSFIAQYRVHGGRGGQQRRYTLGTYPTITVEEARAQARTVLASARFGDDAAKKRHTAREAETVADLIELWGREAAHINRRTGAVRTLSSVEGEMGRIRAHVLPLLGSTRLTDLERAHVERLRDQIARGTTRREEKTKLRGRARIRGGVGTATRTVRMLSSIFAFAVDRGLLKENPARGVRLTSPRAMNRFLSAEELTRLGQALADAEKEGAHVYGITIIRLLALTGARRGEISGARWAEVDLNRAMLRLEKSKTGAKIIHLPAAALAVLNEHPRTDSPYVFPASNGSTPFSGVGKVWSDVRRRANLCDVRLHDLRHTFASFGAAANFGLPVIGALLGHRQPATTARYAHLDNNPVQTAGDRIAGTISAALEGRATPEAERLPRLNRQA
jgi:integrase